MKKQIITLMICLTLISLAGALSFLDSNNLIDSNLDKINQSRMNYVDTIKDLQMESLPDNSTGDFYDYYDEMGDNKLIEDLYLIAKAQQLIIEDLKTAVCKLDPMAEVCQ